MRVWSVTGLTVAVAAFAVRAGVAAADPIAAPSGLSPADGADVREGLPVLRWGATGGEAGWEVWFAVGDADAAGRMVPVPAAKPELLLPDRLGADSHVWWHVRALDAQGQPGPWSDTADFWYARDNVPPEPPADLVVLPEGDGLLLRWTARPSADLAGYRLYVRPEGGSYGAPSAIGPVTSTAIEGLNTAFAHDFMLTAVDASGNESTGVLASFRPSARVTLRGQPFLTIQEALDAAQPGDVVELAAGTFLEGVTLPPGVSLRGAGPGLTVLDATGFPAAVTLESSDGSFAQRSTISSLTLRGGAAGVWGGVANVLLENVVVCRANGPGVRLDAGVLDLARVTIAHCDRDGVDTGASGGAVDTLIFGNGGAGVASRDPQFSVAHSDFYGNLLGSVTGALLGPGVMSVPAQFENEAQDDYRVVPGDPTVDAGSPESPFAAEPAPNGGRVNVGAFGNTPWATPSLEAPAGTRISDGTEAHASGSKTSKYCIVATAAEGSADASTVSRLRALRDRTLLALPSGEKAVGTYEKAAAPVAREVGKSEVLRAVFRSWLGR